MNNRLELGQALQDYEFPRRGAEAELMSLEAHRSRMVTTFVEPNQKQILDAVCHARNEAILREAGHHEMRPILMTVEDEIEDPLDWNRLSDNINAAIDDVNMDASPGVPMMQFGSTNGDVILKERNLVLRLVKERIERLALISTSAVLDDESVEQHLRDGLLDPCRVFIKNEPHKKAKIREGRFRLIWSLSLLDQIIDRVLFSSMAEEEIRKFHRMASKGGAGLSTDEQQRELYQNIKMLLGKDFWTNDMKNWDWSFKRWQYEAFWVRCAFKMGFRKEEISIWLKVLSRKGLEFNTYDEMEYIFLEIPITIRLMWIRLFFMARVPIVLSDGRLLTHGTAGIMKSGLFITLMANSFNRALLSSFVSDYLEANSDAAIAMGDDCGEKLLGRGVHDESIKHAYLRMGFTVTDLEHITNPDIQGFEFCSHRLYPAKAIPLNEVKIVLKHLVSKLRHTREQQFQLENDIRHAKNRDLFLRFLRPRWEAWINDNEESKKYSKENQEDRADCSSSSKRSKED